MKASKITTTKSEDYSALRYIDMNRSNFELLDTKFVVMHQMLLYKRKFVSL